jgi:hypothetical protein
MAAARGGQLVLAGVDGVRGRASAIRPITGDAAALREALAAHLLSGFLPAQWLCRGGADPDSGMTDEVRAREQLVNARASALSHVRPLRFNLQSAGTAAPSSRRTTSRVPSSCSTVPSSSATTVASRPWSAL